MSCPQLWPSGEDRGEIISSRTKLARTLPWEALPVLAGSCRRTSWARGCIQISDTSRGDTPEIIQSANFTCNAGSLWRTRWWCFQRKQRNTYLDSPSKRGQSDFFDDPCLEGRDTFVCLTCYCALISAFQLTLVLFHSGLLLAGKSDTSHVLCVQI